MAATFSAEKLEQILISSESESEQEIRTPNNETDWRSTVPEPVNSAGSDLNMSVGWSTDSEPVDSSESDSENILNVVPVTHHQHPNKPKDLSESVSEPETGGRQVGNEGANIALVEIDTEGSEVGQASEIMVIGKSQASASKITSTENSQVGSISAGLVANTGSSQAGQANIWKVKLNTSSNYWKLVKTKPGKTGVVCPGSGCSGSGSIVLLTNIHGHIARVHAKRKRDRDILSKSLLCPQCNTAILPSKICGHIAGCADPASLFSSNSITGTHWKIEKRQTGQFYVSCPWCDVPIHLTKISEHVAKVHHKECSIKSLQCPACDKAVFSFELFVHLLSSSCVPNTNTNRTTSAIDTSTHWKIEKRDTGHFYVACPWCNILIHLDEISTHVAYVHIKECSNRSLQCPACDKAVLSSEVSAHILSFSCAPITNTKRTIAVTDSQTYWKIEKRDTGHFYVSCPWCKIHIHLHEISNHVENVHNKECFRKSLQCPVCDEAVLSSAVFVHILSCAPNRTIPTVEVSPNNTNQSSLTSRPSQESSQPQSNPDQQKSSLRSQQEALESPAGFVQLKSSSKPASRCSSNSRIFPQCNTAVLPSETSSHIQAYAAPSSSSTDTSTHWKMKKMSNGQYGVLCPWCDVLRNFGSISTHVARVHDRECLSTSLHCPSCNKTVLPSEVFEHMPCAKPVSSSEQSKSTKTSSLGVKVSPPKSPHPKCLSNSPGKESQIVNCDKMMKTQKTVAPTPSRFVQSKCNPNLSQAAAAASSNSVRSRENCPLTAQVTADNPCAPPSVGLPCATPSTSACSTRITSTAPAITPGPPCATLLPAQVESCASQPPASSGQPCFRAESAINPPPSFMFPPGLLLPGVTVAEGYPSSMSILRSSLEFYIFKNFRPCLGAYVHCIWMYEHYQRAMMNLDQRVVVSPVAFSTLVPQICVRLWGVLVGISESRYGHSDGQFQFRFDGIIPI